MVTLPATTQDIGEQLSSQHARDKEQNRRMLLKIISRVRFLARQGLPLRGDGDERNSNFLALLSLREEDDPTIGVSGSDLSGVVTITLHPKFKMKFLKLWPLRSCVISPPACKPHNLSA